MNVYKKLFKYVPNNKLSGYIAILLSSVSSILIVYGYYLIYLFFKEIIIINNYNKALIFAIKIVVYLTLGSVLYIVSGIASHKMAFRLETNLRKRGIDGLTDASFRFFDLNSSGYIRKSIDDNAAKTHTAVAHMLPDNSQAILIPILSLVLAFVVSIRVGIIILLLSIVCGVILKLMGDNKEFLARYQKSLDSLSAETVEYIRGIQVVKIFGTRIQAFKALHGAIIDYSDLAYKYSISCKQPYVIYQLIFLGLIPIICIPLSFFISRINNPSIVAIELIMIFLLSGIIMVSFMKIMWAGMNIFNANYAIDNLEALYKKMDEDKLKYGNISSFNNANIEFCNVSFSYGENKVFNNLSFSLDENKTYAIVGPSGSGKSTIAKLLSGFYTIDSGEIKIGDYSLESYSKDAIIKNIAFVFQNTKLFKMSIYDNVALADKTAIRDEVMHAIELAGCTEIIEKFPNRENTMIGSKGVYLSGGEKQRIAIARAILKKAKIVIMDEASASIDADNEYELQKAFKNLMKDKTVIMIAHRLSSIKAVDEILVLKDGQLIERGDNKTLLEKGGEYSRLFSLYESANEWRVINEKLL